MATSAPSWARRSAMARPMPWSPPVMAMDLPSRRVGMEPPVSDHSKHEMLLGGLWCREEDEVKESRINTEDSAREGGTRNRGKWQDAAIEARHCQKPHRRGRPVGHPGRGKSGYGYVFA